jgi:hypothetical protein
MAKSPVRALVPFITRRRWRAEEARAVLARLKSSGLSVPEFAAQENLDPQRLYRWRAQLGPIAASRPAFIEIKPATRGVEVVLRCGLVVRVSDGFNEATLRRLVAVLDEQARRC